MRSAFFIELTRMSSTHVHTYPIVNLKSSQQNFQKKERKKRYVYKAIKNGPVTRLKEQPKPPCRPIKKIQSFIEKSHSSNEGAIIQLDEAGWTTGDVAGRYLTPSS